MFEQDWTEGGREECPRVTTRGQAEYTVGHYKPSNGLPADSSSLADIFIDLHDPQMVDQCIALTNCVCLAVRRTGMAYLYLHAIDLLGDNIVLVGTCLATCTRSYCVYM